MHYYRYLHDGSVIESEGPRPDLLEWAYWSEIDAPAKPEPVVEPVVVEPEPVEPAKKAPAKKATASKAKPKPGE